MLAMPHRPSPRIVDVLHAHHRSPALPAEKPRVLIAGAAGALGHEVLRLLAGTSQHGQVQVLTCEPVRAALARVEPVCVQGDDPRAWPVLAAQVGVVLFEPRRMYYERERALWVPHPSQLPAVARWMLVCGVHTLAVVMPHEPGRLPPALQQGLASMDEQEVSALEFQRVLWLRSAQAARSGSQDEAQVQGVWRRMWIWWQSLVLSVPGYMLPNSQRPVRPKHIASVLNQALRHAGPGTHVASSELLWRAAQGSAVEVVAAWLGGSAHQR